MKSRYKGVAWNKMYDKWQSLVVVQKGEVTSSPPCDKPNIFGGYWNDDKDAAIISDK